MADVVKYSKLSHTLRDMHVDMVTHSCDCRSIESDDDPIHTLIGFSCECGLKCHITIPRLKNDKNMTEEYQVLIRTQRGREELAEKMNEGWIPEIWVD